MYKAKLCKIKEIGGKNLSHKGKAERGPVHESIESELLAKEPVKE